MVKLAIKVQNQPFFKIGVIKNIAKLQALRLYYRDTPTQVFSCIIPEIFKNTPVVASESLRNV